MKLRTLVSERGEAYCSLLSAEGVSQRTLPEGGDLFPLPIGV